MSTETTTTELDLDAIENRANAATPGPWFDTTPHDEQTEWANDYEDPMVVTLDSVPGNFCAIAQDIRQGSTDGAADAEFIAAARTDVPALAAEVRRLRAELATVTSQRDAHEATAGELRQDLREADENAGFLQQHIENIRNGDA